MRMETFRLLASPWWVNLLVLVPPLVFFLWHRDGIELSRRQLVLAAFFALAFGVVEGAVVVYLRAAVGLLPGSRGTLTDLASSRLDPAPQEELLRLAPQSLLTIEMLREAATILVLISVALLAAPRCRERCALFLWVFALWDVAYYVTLRATIGWPASFTTPDVLFLIPVPWSAQVWFPILVSALTAAAVLLTRKAPV